MKRAAFTALLTLLIAVGAGASVTFATAPVAVGDTWTDISTYSTSITLALNDSYRDLNAPEQNQSSSVSRTKTVKVTGVVGNDKITQIEVEYSAVTIDGSNVSSTFAGKPYKVSVTGNRVNSVTYTDDTTPPDAEVAFVTSDNNRVGQVRAMNQTFGGETVNIGDSLRAHNADDLIDAQSGLSVDDFAMKLASVSGDEATFNVTLSLDGGVNKGKNAHASDPAPFDTSALHIDLAGTLTASVSTSRILSLNLTGPATVTAQKATSGKKGRNGDTRYQTLSGSGSASLSSTYTFQ